ncbi:glycosyltransferase family 2 protein [bacterium]|nr:MAG: glycosyltransferase family 2 protein [bacterium]
MPRFSVVMPVHNRATLVGMAIESVINQSSENCELIVVDDGSTDGTVEAVARFGNRVHLLQQKNAGPGAARNTGIAAAKGDYIAFLDSDDLWMPWTLATYSQIIDQNNSPSLLMAREFSFESEDMLQDFKPEPEQTLRFKDYLASSQQDLSFGASSLVVRTEALRKVGGFEKRWINAEDLDLCLKLGDSPQFIRIESPRTFAYRKHDNSAVSNIKRTLDGLHHLIAQERAGLYPGGKARQRERLEIITRHIRPVTLECLRRGYKNEAWHLYSQTFRWHAFLGRAKFLGAFPILAMKSRGSES